MSMGGLSQARFDRLHAVMAGYVERGDVPGVVTLISRHGEVHVDTIGLKALGDSAPIQRDTIFRIGSMTKPITAAATMLLVEECKLRLDDPVDRFLPELANRTVLKRIDGPLEDTVPAIRAITVRDLLTLRLGLGIILAPSGSYPIQQAVNKQRIVGFGPPNVSAPHTPDEWLRRLATLPLMYQPGEKWMYNTGSAVLGVLIARASGQSLETFLRERLFAPLGMKDTGFSVPATKLDRLVSCYQRNPTTGALDFHDGGAESHWRHPPLFPDAGAGLVSTIDDYWAFGQMLLHKGKHGKQRILSRPAVEVMTTNQLTLEQQKSAGVVLGDNRGWGFGMSIVIQRDDVAAVPGRFGWEGSYGTSWASDPTEDMVAILLTQRLVFPQPTAIDRDFRTTAYHAIDD